MNAYDTLVGLLTRDADMDVRAAAAFALGDLGQAGDRRAIDGLLQGWDALQDPNLGDTTEVVVLLIRALGDLEDRRTFRVLEQAMRLRDDRIRQLAAMGLGRLADPAAVPRLVKALADPHRGVRRCAAEALGHVRDPMALRPMIEAVRAEYAEVRSAIGRALLHFDGHAVQTALDGAAQDADPALRAAAFYLMGQVGDAEGLANGGQDPDPTARKAATLAMGNTGDRRFRPSLEAALGDPDWHVRTAGAEGLRRLGDPAALSALRQHEDDPHRVVRNAVHHAIDALAAIR
jgi:HEAT repeat protein